MKDLIKVPFRFIWIMAKIIGSNFWIAFKKRF